MGEAVSWLPASWSSRGSGMGEKTAGLSRGAVADLLCLHLLLSCTKSYFGEMETNTGPVCCTSLLCVSFPLAVVSGCAAALGCKLSGQGQRCTVFVKHCMHCHGV